MKRSDSVITLENCLAVSTEAAPMHSPGPNSYGARDTLSRNAYTCAPHVHILYMHTLLPRVSTRHKYVHVGTVCVF